MCSSVSQMVESSSSTLMDCSWGGQTGLLSFGDLTGSLCSTWPFSDPTQDPGHNPPPLG